MARIYLDNAATSWPKPEAVYRAMDRFAREVGGSAGRAGHASSVAAGRVVEDARRAVARLLGVPDPRTVVFAFNGTDALSTAIGGALRAGDHVVTTVCEHNSVLRPLRWAEDRLGCRVARVDCDGQGLVDPDEVARAVRDDTRLIAVAHASNVTGAIQPVGEIAERVAGSGALLLVDAAQTLGHVPIDTAALGVDLLAASGHKGLLGPTGTGVLYVRPGVEERVEPLRRGGTGSQSESDRQPEAMPDRFESGNQNAIGLAGLAAGVAFLKERGLESIREHDARLIEHARRGLQEVEGCVVYGPGDPARRAGVVSFTLAGYDPHELAAVLEASAGVECRAGLHCAPAMHQRLGTAADGGTVRLSTGFSTTPGDVEAVVQVVRAVAAQS